MSNQDKKEGVGRDDVRASIRDTPTIEIIEKIIDKNKELARFGRNSEGWVADSASELLIKSRLDWLVSLSHTLTLWLSSDFPEVEEHGRLILGWTNLGSLVEGTMKLFLSMYNEDYRRDMKKKIEETESKRKTKDPDGLTKRKIKDPDGLTFNQLRLFLEESVWLKEPRPKCFWTDQSPREDWLEWNEWLYTVQQRRNAIHAYKHRDIGTLDELHEYIHGYKLLLDDLNGRFPEFKPETIMIAN